MKKMHIWVLVFVVVFAFVFSGCKDIQDSFKPGSFGQSDEESAMIEALTERYGDLTQSGSPRFLEVMVTTNVHQFIPVDIVRAYNENVDELYVWFVYDNFNEDEIEIEWIYLDTQHTIHTFVSQTGKDFGRGSFILEKPDQGWPTGSYQVIVRGRNIEERVNFEIVSGPTIKDSLTIENGKVQFPKTSGWHLTGWDTFINPRDYSLTQTSHGVGSELFDTFEHSGDKNDFYHRMYRSDKNGKILHDGSYIAKWDDPPNFLAPEETPSFFFSIEGEGWFSNVRATVSFDAGHLEPAYATSSNIKFLTEEGSNVIATDYTGTLTSARVIPTGRADAHYAIRVTLPNGYGYRYNYTYKE